MSFPRYPSYKHSGVAWLGDVPTHWVVKPLKFVARLVTEKAEESMNPVALENVESWTGRFIPTETKFSGDGTAFLSGDILFGKLRPYLAKVYLAETSGKAIGEFHVLRRLAGAANAKFLLHQLLCPSFIQILDGTTFGSKMPRASWEYLGGMPILLPSQAEQEVIVAFLDSETAKIDALVAEQERLIELLKEKRQAVISQAVTKGLNPAAPMRESGVRGIGAIPQHWSIMPLKRFATLQRGHDLTDAERQEGPYPVVTSGGFSGTHARFMARAPGVVTGRYGSTGRLFYVEQNYWPHNTALYVVNFHGNCERFTWYSMHTIDFAAHSAKAAVPGIDRNDLHVLPAVVPPLPEQRAITAFLDQELARLDDLRADAGRAIDLLEERRSCLISAAVTGQMDVRPDAMRTAA